MALPQQYIDENQLQVYLVGLIPVSMADQLADALPNAWPSIINEALAMLGVNTVDLANARHLEIAARLAMWRSLATAWIERINFSADGASYSAGDVFARIRDFWASAEGDAVRAGLIASPASSVAISAITGW